MATPAVKEKYGPYYESAIWRQLPQREAVGKAPMTPSQVAGATYGELEARYQTTAERQRAAREWMKDRLAQRTQEKAQKAQERGQAVSGAATVAGLGLKGYQLLKGKSLASQGLLKSQAFSQGKIGPLGETTTPAIPETAPGLEPVISGTELSPIEGMGYGAEPLETAVLPELATSGTSAITETGLAAPAIEAGVTEAAALGTEAAAVGAEAAATVGAETAVAVGTEVAAGAGTELGFLAAGSVLGPIGLIVGGLAMAASLVAGGKSD